MRRSSKRDSSSSASNVNGGHYCGIILDLDMPIMGGLEACERIIKAYKDFEKHSTGKHIPFLSSYKKKESEYSPVRKESKSKKLMKA